MSNLFIVHSEFQLSISLAIILQYYNDDKNDLIMFTREKATKENKAIVRFFDNIVFLDGNEPTEITLKSSISREIRRIIHYNKVQESKIASQFYLRIFSPFPDALLPSIIISLTKKNNEGIIINYLEEGTGFFKNSNNIYYKIAEFNSKHSHVRFTNMLKGLRKIYFKMDYNTSSESVKCDYKNCTELYVRRFLKPNHYDDRITHPINLEVFNESITTLFEENNRNLNEHKKSILIIFDGENIYDRFEKKLVQTLIGFINDISQNKNVEINYKKHPRNSEYLNGLDIQINDLGNRYPSEYYFVNTAKDTIVIGGTSTALTSASSLGLRTYSYANLILNEEQKSDRNDVINYLKLFNIRIFSSQKELYELLNAN